MSVGAKQDFAMCVREPEVYIGREQEVVGGVIKARLEIMGNRLQKMKDRVRAGLPSNGVHEHSSW